MSLETGSHVTPLGDAALGPGKGTAAGQSEWVLAANLAWVLVLASSSSSGSRGSQLAGLHRITCTATPQVTRVVRGPPGLAPGTFCPRYAEQGLRGTPVPLFGYILAIPLSFPLDIFLVTLNGVFRGSLCTWSYSQKTIWKIPSLFTSWQAYPLLPLSTASKGRV